MAGPKFDVSIRMMVRRLNDLRYELEHSHNGFLLHEVESFDNTSIPFEHRNPRAQESNYSVVEIDTLLVDHNLQRKLKKHQEGL